MFLSALILGTATTFGPGTVDDFAQSLADATGNNAIIVTSKATHLKSFTYDASSPGVLASSVRAGAALTMAPGDKPAFSDAAYVGEHFQALAPNLPAAPTTANKLPEDAIRAGKVTLQTKNATPIALQAIADAKWSRPVQVDFLMRDLAVSAAVKDMPELEFLTMVAKAAGGFLARTDAGFSITYDANHLRTRVVNTLKQASSGQVKQELDVKREFYSAVVNILPSDTLLSIFQTPANTPRLDVPPNSDLATVSVAYIRALEELKSGQPIGDSGATQISRRPARANGNGVIPTDILSRVDSRATVHLRLNATGTIVLSVPVITGRTSQYIDM